MFDLLLPVLYALLFGNLILRLRFFRDSPGKWFLLNIFVVKCLLSVLYWQMHVKDYGGGDTLYYFLDGQVIGRTLEHGPWQYIKLVFGYNGGIPSPDIDKAVTAMGYWHDTSAYMVVRFDALVYLFSFGNPYVHGIFMSFVSLTGLTALYKGIITALEYNQPWVRFGVFGIPSVLFWTSGVHKEGLLIFAIGFFFYGLLSIRAGARNFMYVNILLVSAILMYLVRDFVFYLLVPGMFAYHLSKIFPRLGPLFLAGIYLLLVFGGPYLTLLPGDKNYLELIADKQAQFKSLKGADTQIEVTNFDPTTIGMLKQIPQALWNTIVKPMTISAMPISHLVIIVENIFLLLVFVSAIYNFNKQGWHYQPLLAWMFMFGWSLMVLIGFIVPNIGAIVRYRSLALPFIFIPVLYYIKPQLLQNIRKFPKMLSNDL